MPVSDDYSLVKVHWGVKFRKTKDSLIEFDVSYLVQKTGSEPKIILFIAHQDEEQAMKELGLMNKNMNDGGRIPRLNAFSQINFIFLYEPGLQPSHQGLYMPTW